MSLIVLPFRHCYLSNVLRRLPCGIKHNPSKRETFSSKQNRDKVKSAKLAQPSAGTLLDALLLDVDKEWMDGEAPEESPQQTGIAGSAAKGVLSSFTGPVQRNTATFASAQHPVVNNMQQRLEDLRPYMNRKESMLLADSIQVTKATCFDMVESNFHGIICKLLKSSVRKKLRLWQCIEDDHLLEFFTS